MGNEECLTALVLGAIGGLLCFLAILMSTRGKFGTPAPDLAGPAAPEKDPDSTYSPVTPAETGIHLPLRAWLTLGRIYVLIVRLLLIAMVLYGLVVAPRLRWVGLGAAITFTVSYFLRRRIAEWASRPTTSKPEGGRNGVPR